MANAEKKSDKKLEFGDNGYGGIGGYMELRREKLRNQELVMMQFLFTENTSDKGLLELLRNGSNKGLFDRSSVENVNF